MHGKGAGVGPEFRIGDIKCCPMCAVPVDATGSGIVQEYWVAQDRYFDMWCAGCQRHVTLVFADRVVTREPAGNPHDHP